MKTSHFILIAIFLATTMTSRADTVYVGNWNDNYLNEYDSGTGNEVASFTVGHPQGVALDNAGNLYVSSWADETIYKYTPSGASSAFASAPGTTGLAFNSAGNLFEGDVFDDEIIKYNSGGAGSVFASLSFQPYNLVFDSSGNLYVANDSSNSIIKITPAGVQSVFATGLEEPEGMAFNSAGDLFVSNWSSHSIEKFSAAGVGSIFTTALTDPNGLAFDSAGNLFVADEWAGDYGQIDEFSPSGSETLFANDTLGGPSYIAIVPEPSSVALLGLAFAALLSLRLRSQKSA